MNMVNTTNNSTEVMINKLQQLKGKTKIKFHKNISNFYDNMNIRFDDDPFSKNARGISDYYHEVLSLMIVLQTKPQVKNMNNNYYDLLYTAFEIRAEEEVVDNQYENDFISLSDVIIPIIMLEKNVEKNEISDKSFQIIPSIKMMTINENKKLSRNRKRRIDRRNIIIDDMKFLLNKIKSQKKEK